MRTLLLRRRRAAAIAPIALAIALAILAAAARAGDAETETPAKAEQEPGPDGWFDAEAPDGSFRVRLPGPYQAFSQEGKDEDGETPIQIHGVRTTLAAAFGGQTSYLTSCNVREGDERSPKERVEAITRRWNRLGLVEFHRQLELDGQPGIELEMSDSNKVIRSRVYAIGGGACTVLVSWRPFAKPSEAEIQKYFDSFEPIAR